MKQLDIALFHRNLRRIIAKEIFSFDDVKMGGDELLKFPQHEGEIHHAQQENFSLKLVANLTQSWPFISLVQIISELLPKSTKSEQNVYGIESKP